MKQYILLNFWLLFFSASCSSQQVRSLDSNIFGYWITQSYIGEITKTLDPYKAVKSKPYEILIIKQSEQSGDTIKVSFDDPQRSEFSGFNFYRIMPDSSLQYFGYRFWEPEKIEYKESQAHTIKLNKSGNILTRISSTGQETNYYRIPVATGENYMIGLEKLIAKILFTDKYILNNEIIEFTEDGKINGLNGYKSYKLGITYTFDFSLFRNNYIEFFETPMPSGKWSSATENLKNRFSFVFDSDTLKLFEIIEDRSVDYRLIKGPEKYKLVKYGR